MSSSNHATIRITLLGLFSLAIAMGIGRFAFTPLLPLMQDDGLVSISQGGILASVNFIGYWLGAVVVSKIPFSPRTLLRASLVIIGLGTLAMGLSESFALWLFLRWVCGLASAFVLVLVSSNFIRHLTASGHSERLGWVFAGVGTGIALAGLATLAIMVNPIDSARSWQIFGWASLLGALVISLFIGDEVPATRVLKTEQKAPRTPLVWRVIIAYGAMGIGYIIPATYLPVMARAIVPSPLVFGWSWPIFGTAALLSTLFAVRLQRRYSNRQIWAASQIIMAAGLLFPVIYPHILTILIAGLCVGGTFMIITMAGMQEAHRIADGHDAMRHIAVMTAAFASGQIIGPLLASAAWSMTASFSASLMLASLVLVITAVALVAKIKPRRAL